MTKAQKADRNQIIVVKSIDEMQKVAPTETRYFLAGCSMFPPCWQKPAFGDRKEATK